MRCTLTLVLSLCVLLPLPARAQEPTLPSTPVLASPAARRTPTDERRELDDVGHRDAQRGSAWTVSAGTTSRRMTPSDALSVERRSRRLPTGSKALCSGRPRAGCARVRRARARRTCARTLAAPLGPACRILAGLEEDPTAAAIRAQTTAARADAEKSANNTFLTRVHLDGLWTSTASDVRIYGLVGSHISLVDVGRVQFFGPPGVILLSVPDDTGVRHLRAGYTWGMSVRLSDVRLFAPSKNMTLFLTITKVWVPGATSLRSPAAWRLRHRRFLAGAAQAHEASTPPRTHAERAELAGAMVIFWTYQSSCGDHRATETGRLGPLLVAARAAATRLEGVPDMAAARSHIPRSGLCRLPGASGTADAPRRHAIALAGLFS